MQLRPASTVLVHQHAGTQRLLVLLPAELRWEWLEADIIEPGEGEEVSRSQERRLAQQLCRCGADSSAKALTPAACAPPDSAQPSVLPLPHAFLGLGNYHSARLLEAGSAAMQAQLPPGVLVKPDKRELGSGEGGKGGRGEGGGMG